MELMYNSAQPGISDYAVVIPEIAPDQDNTWYTRDYVVQQVAARCLAGELREVSLVVLIYKL